MTCPYSFPLKSRRAIVDFLVNRDSRSYNHRRYAFAWDVKTHGARYDGDSLRSHIEDLDPALDIEWAAKCDSDYDLFWEWAAEAARHVQDGAWTSYPGTDQGAWEFSFEGRSGGWLVLDKFEGIAVAGVYSDPVEAADSKRHGYDIQGAENLDAWPWDRLQRFYRGIVCADSDFTPTKAAKELEYQAAFDRENWEDTKRAESDAQAAAMAAAMTESRPDLYAGAV